MVLYLCRHPDPEMVRDKKNHEISRPPYLNFSTISTQIFENHPPTIIYAKIH